ncbi:MAG: transcriptional coactivator p15/PC4 family protein [Candidatus Harrisonbacteria bacterium]|nr:transcriptional coactivator p15/PC4 family protein [Candidatus Harrisonbacteria bacterium]
MEDQIVYTIKKSETEEVRLTLRNFKGKAYLDLRLYFRAEGTGEFAPTRKGLTFVAELAPEFEKAFQGITSKQMGT